MERWKTWQCFKHSVLKVAMRLRPKIKENEKGLLRLYKDMEDCGGYQDIQVMWEMVHSSCPRDRYENSSRRRFSHGGFCFRSI